MENASKVMYKIANVFNWIEVVFGIIMIVFCILGGTGALQNTENFSSNLGWSNIWVGIYMLVWAVVLIILTRIAYKKNSGKGWDVLFLIVGIMSWNIFYFLGGLFGIIGNN
jgi:hypothetical protein